MMSRISLTCLTLFFCGIAGAKSPNIVFFLVDDLGWSDVGCYGSTFYDTPHIDALAAEGVRFTDAYATCHVCSPSRASILTGKYPARLHLTDWINGRKDFPFQSLRQPENRPALPLEESTLAEILKAHGYATGHFGKWHLGENPAGPLQQGFDLMVPQNWFKGWPKAGYHAPFQLDGISDQPGDYLTDRLTEEALGFIEEHGDEPFFLYLSHFAVHDPIDGRPDLVEKYEDRLAQIEPPEGPGFILEGNPDDPDPLTRDELDQLLTRPSHSGFKVLPNRTVKIKQRQDNPQFAAMVEAMDESLGRVVAKLEELNLTKNTLVIFTSDNGGMAGGNFGNPNRVVAKDKLDRAFSTSNLPLRGAKGWLYEGGIRVPAIIKWPGRVAGGTTCDEPVTGTDYFPTVLDAVGISERPDTEIDGVSLVNLLEKKSFERGPLFWHFPHYSNHGMQSPGGAVRDGDFKLIEYFENGSPQLFNLKDDPGENRDLSKENPEKTRELLTALRQWRENTGASMPTRKQ
jgi:arylsulfatase A-like enzyme